MPSVASITRRLPLGLFAAIVVYVAVRGLILATSFEHLVMPMFELYPMGTMAELRLANVHFPLKFYYDNAAGQLVIGQLTIPFFAVLGPSYMALKLVPATLGLGTLVLVWLLLDRHFSRKAANLGALFFALPPPTLLRYSVVCSGNHFENLFFTTLALLCTYRVFAGNRTRGALVLAGFSCGLALFVFLGALIPVGILLGMYLGLSGWKRAAKESWPAVLGFALGIAPLIVVNAWTSGRGLGFLSAKFGDPGSSSGESDVGTRIRDFLGNGLSESGMFEPLFGVTTATWSALFLAAFALAYVASVPGAAVSIVRLVRGFFGAGAEAPAVDRTGHSSSAFERAKLVPFVLYVPLAALAFGISNLKLRNYVPPMIAGGYRYYLPTLLFALVLAAVWAARWWERGGRTRVAGAILGAVPLACGATGLSIVDWSFADVGNGWHYPGYNFAQMSRGLVSSRNALAHDDIVQRIRTFPPVVADAVIRAMGFNLATGCIAQHRRQEGNTWTLPIDEVVGEWPSEWQATMANGAGTALRYLTRMEARTGDLPDLLRRVRPATGPLAEEVTAGSAATPVALVYGFEVRDVLDEDVELMKMDVPLHAAFARGFGIYCGRLYRRGVPHEAARAELEKKIRAKDADFVAAFERAAAGADH